MAQQSSASLPVLLVDDEPTVLLSSRMILGSAGIKQVLTLEDSRQVMPLLAEQEVSVVILDLFMPYISGTQLLPEIVREHPEIPVIVMTASQEIETAVACMKEGAFDYLVKPVEENRFVSSVKRALELRDLRRQMGALKRSLMNDELEHGEAFFRHCHRKPQDALALPVPGGRFRLGRTGPHHRRDRYRKGTAGRVDTPVKRS
jgi:DNA-binding NtrC family response regulator